jgi:transposase
MKKIRENCAGIDIGAKKIFVAIESSTVKSFDTFTESFELARDYLLSNGIKSVAMEATGVYWTILYDLLEASGLEVWLVDGRQTRQVPGRKTDVKDCQWIQELFAHGLLNKCFVANDDLKKIRTYQRQREDHIRSASMHINHMQKSLTQMNIRLKEVLSQLHGASGLNIIKAILSGERDSHKLLSLCHKSIIENKADLILKSLNGHYKEEYLFTLQQAYDAYCFYQDQIRSCDEKIEAYFKERNKGKDIPRETNRKSIRHNKPKVDNLGGHLKDLYSGKDATKLPGITDYTWLQIYAEVGNDLSKWPTEKHFTSWLGLAPKQHQSGKMNKKRFKKHKPKAGLIFRQIAVSLIESKKIGLGTFGRKIRSRRSPMVAIKAVARKLAVLFWRMMMKGMDYVDQGIEYYQIKMNENKRKWVEKNAFELVVS